MIALQLYPLRRRLADPSRVPEVLERVRETGYQAVELAGLGPIGAEALAAALEQANLVACAAHVAWPRLRDDTDRVVEECRLWGCAAAVVPVLPAEYRSAPATPASAPRRPSWPRGCARPGCGSPTTTTAS